MTREQSLKNIEAVKNFISPFDLEHSLFLKFESEDTFICIVTKNDNHASALVKQQSLSGLPYAYFYTDKNGLDYLYYIDKICTSRVRLIDNKKMYLSFSSSDSSKAAKNEFFELLKIFKKMA